MVLKMCQLNPLPLFAHFRASNLIYLPRAYMLTRLTVRSNFCKLAAVGLGWDRSFDFDGADVGPDRRWIEIDNHGNIAPIWQAFEIFG
jgi:hypothetical protein